MATTVSPSPDHSDEALRASPLPWERTPVALCLAALVAWLVTPDLPYLDDSYIVRHAAQVIRTGHDAAYDAPALVGITSPAYLALVVMLQAAGLTGRAALQAAGVLGVCAWLMGAWTLAGDVAVRGWRRLAVPAILLVSGHVLLTATNGLETGWATALVTWALVFATRAQPYHAAVACGVLLGMRPDLAPVAAVLGAMAARSARRAVPVLVVAGLVLMPCVIWMRLDTGAWWPQTLAAKRVFFAEGCRPLVEKLRWSASLLAIWAWQTVPVAVGLAAALWTRTGRAGLAASALVLGAYAWTLPGGIAHNEFRYLTPLLVPWAGLGLATMIRGTGRVATAAIVFASIVVAAVTSPATTVERGFAGEMVDVARWIDAETPADATILVHDAGALAVLTNRRLVDVIGLKTPASIAVHARLTWPSCGGQRAAAIDAIAATAHASYLVVLEDWERYFAIARGLTDRGWQLTRVRAHVPGARSYDIYRIQRVAAANAPAGSDVAPRPTTEGHTKKPTTHSNMVADSIALQTNATGR